MQMQVFIKYKERLAGIKLKRYLDVHFSGP